MASETKPHPFFKKMQGGMMINSQAKQIILNVFFQLSSLSPHKTYTQIGQEAAMLTGVSFNTIFKLKAEKQKSELFGYEKKDNATPAAKKDNASNDVLSVDDPNRMNAAANPNGEPMTETPAATKPSKRQKREPRPVSPRSLKKRCRPNVVRKKRLDKYDESIQTGIRMRFHFHTSRNNPPTIGEFYKEVNADEHLPNFSRATFHRLMKDMGLLRQCKRPARLLNQGKAQVGKKPPAPPRDPNAPPPVKRKRAPNQPKPANVMAAPSHHNLNENHAQQQTTVQPPTCVRMPVYNPPTHHSHGHPMHRPAMSNEYQVPRQYNM